MEEPESGTGWAAGPGHKAIEIVQSVGSSTYSVTKSITTVIQNSINNILEIFKR